MKRNFSLSFCVVISFFILLAMEKWLGMEIWIHEYVWCLSKAMTSNKFKHTQSKQRVITTLILIMLPTLKIMCGFIYVFPDCCGSVTVIGSVTDSEPMIETPIQYSFHYVICFSFQCSNSNSSQLKLYHFFRIFLSFFHF